MSRSSGLVRRLVLFVGLAGIYLLFLLKIIPAQAESDLVHVEWVVDDAPERGWTVGDRIPLRLTVTYPSNWRVMVPELPEVWGSFEVREQTLMGPTTNKDGMRLLAREVTVTLWEPGDHQTPPLSVRYQDADGVLHETQAPQLSITVVSVLEEGETEKRDLKPQAALPSPRLWPWIMGGMVLTALIGIGGWAAATRLRRQTTLSSALAVPIDPRPPHEIAYCELDRIAALDLPARGELKYHYTLIADCVRTYIKGRYHIPAMDQTTEELMISFRRNQTDDREVSLFRELLAEADVVKFSKHVPSIYQAQGAIAQARRIVDVTRSDNVADATHDQAPNSESRSPNHKSRDK